MVDEVVGLAVELVVVDKLFQLNDMTFVPTLSDSSSFLFYLMEVISNKSV
jgi:hypothetical protein